MLSKIILVLSLLLVPTFLAAKKTTDELEARNGDSVLRIASTPCVSKIILDQLKPEYHKQFRKAELKVAGKPTAGCWTMDDTGVYVILENGDQGYVPPNIFKPVEVI